MAKSTFSGPVVSNNGFCVIFVKGHVKSVNELLKVNGHAYEYHGEKKKVFGD